MTGEVQKLYGNRLRVRACGLLVSGDRLLMVNHKSLSEGDFWAPPGGGVNFGEPTEVCLRREFLEETGLEIEIVDFLFVAEFIKPPLHAIELFFRVNLVKGDLTLGKDPEMNSESQIIKDVKFLSWNEIKNMETGSLHGIFQLVKEPEHVMQLEGYLKL